MKRILIILFSIAFAPFVKAQFCRMPITNEKVYVQKTGVAEFDKIVENAMAKHWKISSYQMIETNYLKGHMIKSDAYLLSPIQIGHAGFTSGLDVYGSRTDYYYALLKGGKSDVSSYTYSDVISFFPLWDVLPGNFQQAGDSDPAQFENVYLIENVIAAMNSGLEMCKSMKKNFLKFRDAVIGNNENFFDKDIAVLKTKTLYVPEHLLTKDVTTAAIAKVYPYKFKVVNSEEYKKAILSEGEDVVYLQGTDDNVGGVNFYDARDHKCVGGLFYPNMKYFRLEYFKHIKDLIKEYEKKK